MSYLFVGAGAFFGGILRAYLGSLFNSQNEDFPYGTLYANLIGALLIGILGALATRNILSGTTNALLIGGFCGGLTTFSTFSFETVKLFIKKELNLAFVYWLGTLVVAVSFTWFTYHLFLIIF